MLPKSNVFNIDNDTKKVSDEFNSLSGKSPFYNSGFMIDNKVNTQAVEAVIMERILIWLILSMMIIIILMRNFSLERRS